MAPVSDVAADVVFDGVVYVLVAELEAPPVSIPGNKVPAMDEAAAATSVGGAKTTRGHWREGKHGVEHEKR